MSKNSINISYIYIGFGKNRYYYIKNEEDSST